MTAIPDRDRMLGSAHWIGLAMLVLSALGLVFLRGHDGVPLKTYHFTQYLFTYEDEFLKRGLTGELLRRVFGTVSFETVTALAWVQLGLYGAMLAALAVAIVVGLGFSATGWLLALAALTSPATLGHFIFDFGRSDAALLLLMAGGICLVMRPAGPAAVLGMSGIAALSLFIHEAAFFLTLPLMLAVWAHADRRPGARVAQALWCVAMVVLTYGISTAGLAQVLSFETQLAALEAQYGALISPYALEVLYMNLEENVAFTAEEAVSRARALHHVFMVLVLSPLLIAILRVVRGLYRARDWASLLVMLACLGPLLLYPLGHDHFRWWAIAVGHLFLAIALLLHMGDDALRAAIQQDRWLPWLCLAASLLGLIAGPLEVRASFDIAPSIIAAMGLSGPWLEL